MRGRFTVKATWAELVALYRLTMDGPPHNLRPRFNVCPTDPVDVVTAADDKHELVTMRWGLVPRWWSKPLKELRMATFNARAETVETKPVFRDAFKRSRCLIPMSGYYEWQDTPGGKQPWYFTAADGSPLLTAAGGRMEEPGEWRAAEVLHDDYHRAKRHCCTNPRPHAGVFDRKAIRAMADRGGGCGSSEASAERLTCNVGRYRSASIARRQTRTMRR
jgi:SOS response associated peptidase (SRAP)